MAFLHRFGEKGGERRDVLDDIAENLAAVLNTKREFGSVGSELGVGNYLSRIGRAESVQALTDEFETCISRYEPRLSDTQMKLIGKTSALDLIFELTGLVGNQLRRFRIRFNTQYGNVIVERVQTP